MKASVHSLYIPYKGTIPFRTMRKDKVEAHGKISQIKNTAKSSQHKRRIHAFCLKSKKLG